MKRFSDGSIYQPIRIYIYVYVIRGNKIIGVRCVTLMEITNGGEGLMARPN